LELPTITLVLRGSMASEGSFCRPRERPHSASVASVDGWPVTIV
jgi:hypothetical protein